MSYPPANAGELASLIAGTPQPVTAEALPLPTGAATDASVQATASADRIVAIAASDTIALSPVPKALIVLTTGNLALRGTDTSPVTVPVTAGQIIPLRARYVLSTGTTATVAALI